MAELTHGILREQLTAERAHVQGQLSQLGHDNERESFDENFADSGQVTAERGEVDALVGALLELLEDIDAALAKIDAGTYGLGARRATGRSPRRGSRRCRRPASASSAPRAAGSGSPYRPAPVDRVSVIFFVGLVVAVILHELSHGVVALWFGDDTAKKAGRLTLNPVPHIDPFGSLILPALGALSGAPILGWAKPVPVNPARLRNGRRDMLLVSLAGPATNLALASVAALFARGAYATIEFGGGTYSELPLVVLVPFLFAMVNLFLGLFNLVPIPPLDGSAILERMLPRSALEGWYRFRPYGMLVLFVLVFSTGFVATAFTPVIERLYEFTFGA